MLWGESSGALAGGVVVHWKREGLRTPEEGGGDMARNGGLVLHHREGGGKAETVTVTKRITTP